MYLLGSGEHGVGLVAAAADADDHVARVGQDAQDRCGQDLMLLGGKGVEDHAALGLADALNDDLLGGLGGDAAELLRLDIDVHEVAELRVLVDLARGVERNFGCGRQNVVHDLLLHIHVHVVALDLDEHIVGVAFFVLFISGNERLRDLIDHVGLRDAALFFELRQSGENFGVHFSRVLLVKNPHEAASWRPRFFQISFRSRPREA